MQLQIRILLAFPRAVRGVRVRSWELGVGSPSEGCAIDKEQQQEVRVHIDAEHGYFDFAVTERTIRGTREVGPGL